MIISNLKLARHREIKSSQSCWININASLKSQACFPPQKFLAMLLLILMLILMLMLVIMLKVLLATHGALPIFVCSYSLYNYVRTGSTPEIPSKIPPISPHGASACNLSILPPNKEPRQKNGRNRHDQKAEADHVGNMIAWPKDSAVDVRSDDATKLGHGIGETNSDTCRYCTFESSNSFRPDHGICRSGTRNRNYKS
jgi:hypothetical protein